MKPETREQIKQELLEAARQDKHFTTTTAFYWLQGYAGDLPLRFAVGIVDELRNVTPYPFAD